MIRLEHGDCLEVMKKLDSESISSCVTDPPYHLKATKDSDSGFMQAKWDGGDIAFQTEVWREVYRVLKPGGYVLAFGSPRTFHRLACALEDSNFEIKNVIAWMYATGFPHGMAIGKAVQKHFLGHPQGGSDPTSPNHGKYKGGRSMGAGPGQFMEQEGITDGRELCEEAKAWSKYNTELKPSWEPIIMAMKPIDGNYVNNALKHGVAGLNIDDCRIDTKDDLWGGAYCKNKKGDGKWGTMHRYVGKDFEQPSGRYPSNVILSHSSLCEYKGTQEMKAVTGGGGLKTPGQHGVYGTFKGHEYQGKLGYFDENGNETIEVWDCVEDCPVRMLNEQTKSLKGGKFVGHNRNSKETANKIYGKYNKDTNDACYGDSGGPQGSIIVLNLVAQNAKIIANIYIGKR